MQTNNDRKNKPSASGLAIDFACLGRPKFVANLPEPDVCAEDAKMRDGGNLIHWALSANLPMDEVNQKLTPDQQDKVQRMQKKEIELIQQWRDDNGIQTITEYVALEERREERLWYADIFSGQFDHVLIYRDAENPEKDCAIVIDYKSGWAEQDGPDENIQLRAYALLVQYNYGVNRIRVAIVQDGKHYPPCDYGPSDLVQSANQIEDWNTAKDSEFAKRTPGTHCRWCKGKSVCPEALREFGQLPVVAAENSLTSITNEFAARLIVNWSIIEGLQKTAKAQLLKLDDSTLDSLSLKRTKGYPKASVTDPTLLKSKLSSVPRSVMIEAENMSLTPIVKWYQDQGMTEKEAKAKVHELGQGSITFKTTADGIKEK